MPLLATKETAGGKGLFSLKREQRKTMTKKLRLLLADDDPDVVWGIGRALTRHGISVFTCGDGLEAVQLLEVREIDVLVTDIQMPALNGLALIEWVRQNRPQIRVVVMTAFGSPSIRLISLRKGALLYLEKPVDPQLLLEVLRSSQQNNSFSGSINGIDLFDYVQLMMVTRRDAVLEVSSQQGQPGLLYLRQGNVCHATCDDAEGEEAFFRCLAFDSGSFNTLPWREPERNTIETPGEFLLMEAARRKDESRKDLKDSLPLIEEDIHFGLAENKGE